MLDRFIRSLEQAIYMLAGEEFNINSPKQLGIILFAWPEGGQEDQNRLLHRWGFGPSRQA